MATLKFVIPRDGLSKGDRKISTDAVGFVGEACKVKTDAFTQAFGSSAGSTLKEDFYRVSEPKIRVEEGGPPQS